MTEANAKSEMLEYNRQIIEEFRTNGGKVGGRFEGAPLLLLTTIGAKTGTSRTNPVTYMPDGERLIIIASNAGSDDSPAWYYNLLAHPQVTVEVGTETFEATAIVLQGEERNQIYARNAERAPMFAQYQANTTRLIPAVALERSKTV